MNSKKFKIAIVGAGPCGLCAAKHALKYGHDVTVFEQNSEIGGLWDYTEKNGNNEFGIPIHNRMYQGLRTNAPTLVMGFMDHPFPETGRSYVSHEEVLTHLESYANAFNLNHVIKFRNQVVNVRPLPGDRWEVLSKDLKNNIYETKEFDAIFICNGHYSAPIIPNYDGLNEFIGNRMHSKDYRRPDQYQDETVLIIGAGNSGRDIAFQVATKAKQVIWSNHSKFYDFSLTSKFPSNLKKVDDVKRFRTNSVELINGDIEEISCVLFCTGYKYSFPFLSVDCGINLKDRWHIEPLYKEVLNIKHPTMAMIGISPCILTYLRHDLQVILCLKYWSREIDQPSKTQMLDELMIEYEKQSKKGFESRKCHLYIDDMVDYLIELCEICDLDIIPKVFRALSHDFFQLIAENPTSFREFNYKILDNETFERKHISE